MELFSTESFYILLNGSDGLWINRKFCEFSNRSTGDLELIGAKCLGLVYGYVGKLDYSDQSETRLVFIKSRELVGTLKGCEIFKISSVASLPLETDIEARLDPCQKHHKNDVSSRLVSASATISENIISSKVTSARNLSKLKSSPSAPSQSIASARKPERINKVDKRVLDDFHKMFTEANSFYYSNDYDITNTTQRTFLSKNNQDEKSDHAKWYQADNRFIWNIFMIDSLIHSKDPTLNKWILPIIQGFVQYETCDVEHLFDYIGPDMITIHGHLELWLISRRSRFRAGTRYRRRGIDENGKTANYVETEQIIIFNSHVISFVQIRGSVPIFWGQPGYRYRPPPRIERPPEESFKAFTKHIAEDEGIYGPVYLVNLCDKTGKEKTLGDGFMEMIFRYNRTGLTYLTFDFHESCRGMHFENVATLIHKLMESIKDMNYCWIDSFGIVLQQRGVCRTNCVDCLDRTNVVQTHLGKHVMAIQLSKLGLLAPEIGLPENLKLKIQSMWANNGDTISRQYAGTNALKGDYTRTGERKISGALKDGMNSANRYYMNRFKDAYRQAAIDAMLGMRRNFTEDYLDAAAAGKPEDEGENTAEQVKTVIEDAKKCLVPKFDVILGAWGLVNAKNNDPDILDVDLILILTENHYYATEYDCNLDAITETQKVHLSAVIALELGFESLIQPSNFWSFFQGTNAPQAGTVPSLRINYKSSGDVHFHQFRSSNMRFFNNVTVQIQQPDEMFDALKMIAQAIQSAAHHIHHKVKLEQLAILPTREPSRQSMNSVATSWVHRYFSFAPVEVPEQEASRKFTANSFERFTPKYFRRGSSASTETSGTPKVVNIDDNQQDIINEVPTANKEDLKKNIKNLILPLKIISPQIVTNQYFANDAESILGASSVHTDLHALPYPALSYLKSNDLVLSSCGLVSVPATSLLLQKFQPTSLSTPPPHLYPTSELPLTLGVGCNEQDTLSASFSPSRCYELSVIYPMNLGGDNQENSTGNNFARHRYSLPSQSLGIGLGPFVQRSITPEIKITEEEPSDTSTDKPLILASALNIKRMSKSSEDVTKIQGQNSLSTALKSIKLNTGNTQLSLTPGLDSVRSTSVQDLTGSILNMKCSLSENTLRDTRFQTSIQQSSTSSKNRLVFAPLGKLARGMQNIGTQYFDPRKLRDTFKPQNTKKEPEILYKEDKEELRILEERKKNCKSIIIEL